MGNTPKKDLIKKKAASMQELVPQSISNPAHKGESKLAPNVNLCNYPDNNSVVVNERQLLFSKKKITDKVTKREN